MYAILVKIYTNRIKKLFSKQIIDIQNKFLSIYDKGLVHCCGEGGEFESFVLDCPIFKKKIVVKESDICVEDDRLLCYVARINFKKLRLVDKK